MKFLNVITLAVALVSSASANTFRAHNAQDIFVPVITSPTANTVWIVGTTVTVTWETADAPTQITNPTGQIMLVKGGVSTPLVLATGFNILTGSASFVIPNIVNATNYEVQLFGDSRDLSSPFIITGSNSLFSF